MPYNALKEENTTELQLQVFAPGGYAANCYLLTKADTAVLIDATADCAHVKRALLETGAKLAAILLTHGHFDHMLRAKELVAAFAVPLFLHASDAACPGDGEQNASAFFFKAPMVFAPADRLLCGGEALCFGSLSLRALHTPGHTAGSLTYLCGDLAFTGDTLFARGYGRTDLPGGDPAALQRSLTKLATLPSDTRIYPGHGNDAALADALRLTN